MLAELLRILDSTLDDPPYNLMFFQLPTEYHFNIRIQPIVSRIAGFERSSGIYVNPVPPETAAAELRNFCTLAERLINYRTRVALRPIISPEFF